MTALLVFGLLGVGVFLSAFFSGMEIGFYRVTRLRLLLDALGGDRVSRGLFWLTNHPSLYVAATLVGNNLANDLVSLAAVMGAQTLLGTTGHTAELILPLVLAPVLLVYGELLPKSLFLQAPNRLLRRGGPLFLLCVALFSPVIVVLWGLSRALASVIGDADEPVRLRLARRELQGVLEEGHEAGVLYPTQRSLAQGLFALAGQPVTRFMVPLEQWPRACSTMAKPQVLRLAEEHRIAAIVVQSAPPNGRFLGYVRAVDLALGQGDELAPLYSLAEIPAAMTHLAALMHMQTGKQTLGRVVGDNGETLGIVTLDRLREPLLQQL